MNHPHYPPPTFQRPPWGMAGMGGGMGYGPARLCARCTYVLQPTRDPSGMIIDHCYRCGGTFLHFGTADKVVGAHTDPRSWPREAFARPPQVGWLQCPNGHGNMWVSVLGWEGKFVEIDSCGHCQGMWLDAREAELLGEITAAAHAETARPGSSKGTIGTVAVYVLQLATMIPVEVYNPVKRKAILVRGLVIGLIPIFVLELFAIGAFGEPILNVFALYPPLFLKGCVYQLVTYAFLHGSIPHLLGNLYFLWIFGDNVEDRLGRGRFALLYMVSAIVGGLVHFLGNIHGTQPMVGASGAIAGLMGAYLVLFPRVKVWVVFFFFQFKLRAVWYLLLWVALQFLELLDPKQQVAWLCHLGGFAAGVVLALLLDPARKAPAQQPYGAVPMR